MGLFQEGLAVRCCGIVYEFIELIRDCIHSPGSTLLSQPWPAAIHRFAKRVSKGAMALDNQGAKRCTAVGNA